MWILEMDEKRRGVGIVILPVEEVWEGVVVAEAQVWKLAILVKCGEEAGDVGDPEEEEEEGTQTS